MCVFKFILFKFFCWYPQLVILPCNSHISSLYLSSWKMRWIRSRFLLVQKILKLRHTRTLARVHENWMLRKYYAWISAFCFYTKKKKTYLFFFWFLWLFEVPLHGLKLCSTEVLVVCLYLWAQKWSGNSTAILHKVWSCVLAPGLCMEENSTCWGIRHGDPRAWGPRCLSQTHPHQATRDRPFDLLSLKPDDCNHSYSPFPF